MNTMIINRDKKAVKGFLPFYLFTLLLLATACSNGEQEFPDFEYQTVYFAKQYPVRTVELGNDDYVDLTNDNQHKVMLMATMGGAYDNRRDITVDIAIDPTLCDGLSFKSNGEQIVVMPESYYRLASNQITIPAGQISAGVEVELTDAFFADEKSLTTHYVIPVRMVKATGVDSILSNKNFTLYAVKYINRYQAYYLNQKNNEVFDITTASLSKSVFTYGAKDAAGKDYPCVLELSFGNDGNCTVTTQTEGFTVQGSGRFVEADETQLLGARHPDTLYLKFTVSNTTLGIDASEDLTLVVRNRGVVPETFEVVEN